MLAYFNVPEKRTQKQQSEIRQNNGKGLSVKDAWHTPFNWNGNTKKFCKDKSAVVSQSVPYTGIAFYNSPLL
jgi:hypothetical protein